MAGSELRGTLPSIYAGSVPLNLLAQGLIHFPSPTHTTPINRKRPN
jgi:hypothetical protein